MNKVILMGRLVRDPEVRYSQGENASAVANFTLAVDRRFRRNGAEGEQSADFLRCVAFGKLAEFTEKYLRQGIKVVLTGRIQTGSYVNREGVKVYTTDIVAEDLEFAESKAASDNYRSSMPASPRNAGGTGASARGAGASGEDALQGFMNIPDTLEEDLPFS